MSVWEAERTKDVMCNVPERAIFKVLVVLTGKRGKINDRVCVIVLTCSLVNVAVCLSVIKDCTGSLAQ